MIQHNDQLSLELATGSYIARGAIYQWNRVQFGGLQRHLRVSGLTAGFGILGSAAMQLFITIGPTLAEDAAVFAMFLLLLFSALAVVGLLTFVDPIVALLAQRHLRDLEEEVAAFECTEESEWWLYQSDWVANAFKDLISSPKETRRVVDAYRPQIEKFLRLYSTAGGHVGDHRQKRVA